MVSSISGTSRAIFALCSLIAARGGFAGAEAVQSDLKAAVQNGFESTGPAQSGFEGAGAVQADISACLNKAGVFVSVPTTSSWVLDTEAWNSRVSPKPSGVVFPKTEEQVTAALKCAASAGVKVTTLGGNRSFSSLGFGRNDGALVMNLKHMKNLKYDESTQLLSFGGPVMISEAVNYLWKKYGRTLPHGRCPDVGMTGVVISGFGTLSRECGTMLDNLRSIRVALADGSIVDADANQNSDLFWGVRGATSSLGVVLVFKIKTFAPPSQRVTDYTIGFKSDIKPTQQDNVDALIGMQNWAMSNDNNDLISIRYNLRTNSTLQGFYYGSGANAKLVLGSLMKKLPASMALISNEEDFYASENISTPGIVEQTLTPRRYFYITSVTIPEDTPLTNATAWSLFANSAYAPKLPDAVVSGFVDMWGGKYTKRVRADDSAWKHDNNLLLVRLDMRSSAFDVKFADSSLSTMRDRFYKFVDDYKVSGGVPGSFPTYRDDKLTVPEMAEYLYGGGNYQKLQKIKTKYDSMEMFNTDPQAIPALKTTS